MSVKGKVNAKLGANWSTNFLGTCMTKMLFILTLFFSTFVCVYAENNNSISYIKRITAKKKHKSAKPPAHSQHPTPCLEFSDLTFNASEKTLIRIMEIISQKAKGAYL